MSKNEKKQDLEALENLSQQAHKCRKQIDKTGKSQYLIKTLNLNLCVAEPEMPCAFKKDTKTDIIECGYKRKKEYETEW